jgi:5-methyltetrahydropteroyltriglutamate--homocysteine methyltransferase
MKLTTTVVGSYPTAPTKKELMQSVYGKDPFFKSIEEAVGDQVAAGVDIISDGQTRGDMIRIVTQRVGGFVDEGGVVRVVDELYRKGDIVTEEFKHAKRIAGGTRVKGILTGPMTIAIFVKNEHYRDRRDLVLDLAGIIADEASKLAGAGAEYVQIDEPVLSAGGDLELGLDALRLIAGKAKTLALHVCGDVTVCYPKLLEYPVQILDHEFSKNPGLLEALTRYDFDKRLGYGCVDSKSEEVEKISEIKERIGLALKHFDKEDLLIDPDCGLRNLTRESALKKLKAMVQASRELD